MHTPSNACEDTRHNDAAAAPIYGPLLKIGQQTLHTDHGAFAAHLFQNLVTRHATVALTRGDITSVPPLLARVHSSCVTSETFGARDCDCAEQLDGALRMIAAEGRGTLFYLMQEGRGAGLTAKARDRMMVQASSQRLSTFDAYERMGLAPDHRSYDEVNALCHLLDIAAPLVLLTNNPDKVAALHRAQLGIHGTRPLRAVPSPFNVHYLAAKHRSGHDLHSLWREAHHAEPPERVVCIDPAPLPQARHIMHTASYLLPLQQQPEHGNITPDATSKWFRLHVYVDLERSVELVVLAYGDGAEVPLVRIQREDVLERFPLRRFTAKADWWQAMRAFVDAGNGYAVFLPPTLFSGADAVQIERSVFRLLTHHLAGRPARLLLDGANQAFDQAVAAGLADSGVRLRQSLYLRQE